MGHKRFKRLEARVAGSTVELSFFRSQETDPPPDDAGTLAVRVYRKEEPGQAWGSEELGVPVFCVEWPDERYNMDENVRSKRGETTVELLAEYQRRHYEALSAVLEALVAERSEVPRGS